jgi:site-specific recombinase XerD
MSAAGPRRMIERLGKSAKMPFGVHPHMLRHATGFKLANQGVDTRSLQQYLGHKNIEHTVRYTELSSERFRDFLQGLTHCIVVNGLFPTTGQPQHHGQGYRCGR